MTSGFGFGFMNSFGMSQAMRLFKGMTGHYDIKPDSTKQYDLTQNYLTMSGTDEHSRNNIIGQMLKQIGKALDDRNSIITEIKNVKDTEIVQNIVSVIEDDCFNSISDETFMSVEYITDRDVKSKLDVEIQDEIDSFCRNHDLTGLARDIIRDFMLYGEYFITSKIVRGKGVVEIIDNCDVEDYLAIYRGRQLYGYIRYNRKAEKYELLDKDDLTHFVLDNNKIKVKIVLPEDIENIPETMRVGQSIIYPVLNSLRKLNVLETTSLAMELKRVLAPILVTVDMQPDADNQNVTEAIDRYENILNSMNSEALNSDNMSVGDILQTASRFKVIPKFTDGKGGVEQIQFNTDNADLNNRINDIKKGIALATGVPSFYLSYGDQLVGKTEMLKVYSAYARKLVGIQTSFGAGMRNLVYKHLFHKGYYVNESNIKIKFKSVTNVDMMDDMEVLVNLVTTVRDFFNLIQEISSSDQFSLQVDNSKLLEFFNTFTSSFPKLQGVLKLYKDGEEEQPSPPSNDGEFKMPKSTTPSRTPTQSTVVPSPTLSTPSPQTPKGSTGATSSPATPPPAETPNPSGQVNIGDVF